MAAAVLTDRVLNRATLSRQLLLERSESMAPLDAVHHLVGLQAQNPLDPYRALWSRLEGFDPHAVGALVENRALVRLVATRGTLHLVTADDALVLRPVAQPVLDAELARHRDFAPHLVGVDLEPVLRFVESLLADAALTGQQLRAALAEEFPRLHAPALAYACRCRLALVQVPPRGVWGRTGLVTSTTVDAWLGRPLSSAATVDNVVLRYLAAFGPATAADVATWSRLAGMGEVLDRLRRELVVLRSERDQELFDLPDAPRPAPHISAPVRLLPEYDNALLSHDDRSRFGAHARCFAAGTGPFNGSVLIDGEVRAIWHPERDDGRKHATLVVEHLRVSRQERSALEREAERMAQFWFTKATQHDVRLVAVD